MNLNLLKIVLISFIGISSLDACVSKVSISSKLMDLFISTCDKTKVEFSTAKSKIPDNIDWKQIGFAKELINLMEKVVVFSGGKNPLPMSDWENFHPFFPWQKNINRNLLFQKTAFFRSPGTDVNCQGTSCIKERDYKGYTWIDLAQPVCVEFIPEKTDILKPAKGHVVIKTIQKCQAIYYENFIYQLTDNKGNFYVVSFRNFILENI